MADRPPYEPITPDDTPLDALDNIVFDIWNHLGQQVSRPTIARVLNARVKVLHPDNG